MAKRSFEEIHLADLATELGVVKGTLYLYFPTKQDLFVSILVGEMEGWWNTFKKRRTTHSLGKDLTHGLEERSLLVRLLASLHMTIEPGLSLAGLQRMKDWFRDFALKASQDLEERCPGISGRGFRLLMAIYALVVGVAQLAFPPENVRALIEADESLSLFRIQFGPFLAESIDSLYHGTLRSTARSNR
jgi:AcrR family transcriptional regulator